MMYIKIKQISLFLSIALLSGTLMQCDSNQPCFKARTIKKSLVVFELYDRHGIYNLLSLGVNEPGYYPDSVHILNNNMEVFTGFVFFRDGKMNLYPFQEDEDFPLHQELEKRYYLYISQYDMDTIDIRYKLGPGECKPVAVVDMDLWYNGHLVLESVSQPPVDAIGYFRILKD